MKSQSFLLRQLSSYLNQNEIKRMLRKRPKKQILPIKIEREYATYLKKYVENLKDIYLQVLDPILPQIIQVVQESKPTIQIDSYNDIFSSIFQKLSLDFDKPKETINNTIDKISKTVVDTNSLQWSAVVKSVIGIEPLFNETWIQEHLSNFQNRNAQLIKKLTDDTRNEIEGMVRDGFSRGDTIGTIRQKILGSKLEKGVFNKIETRAQLIARDQVNKLNGQISQLRQNEIGIDTYFWRTSLDERVRPTHEKLEGKLCKWSDPLVYSKDDGKTWIKRTGDMVHLHTGQDYNCRCWAEPNMKALIDKL